MRLSDLFAVLNSKPDVDVKECSAYLVEPDQDGTDVDLVEIGRVEVDYDQCVARMYPAEGDAADEDEDDGAPFLDNLLAELPKDVSEPESNLRLVAEVPLMRETRTQGQASLVEISGVRIDAEAGEVWLLTRPAEEFPVGTLPG